jgi:hypothetical protein
MVVRGLRLRNSEKCNGTKMVIFNMYETTGKGSFHFYMKIMG